MATHELRLAYDDATGTVAVTHRCTTQIGGHAVGHAEEVALSDPEAVAAWLKGLVDANRAEMEGRTGLLAIQHVAAVSGVGRKGVKRLELGGTLGPVGATTNKGD